MKRPASPSLCEWHACSGCKSPVAETDPTAARTWAAAWVGDDTCMAVLRQALHALPGAVSLSLSDDQSVVEQVAQALAVGQLKVCGPAQPLKLMRLVVQPPAPVPAAPAPSRRVSAPSEAPPPDTTFGDSLDTDAMIQALRQAAAAGVPFCEACQAGEQEPQTAEAGV